MLSSLFRFLTIGLATSTLTISFIPLHSARVVSILAISIFFVTLYRNDIAVRRNGLLLFSLLLAFVVYSGFQAVFSETEDFAFWKKVASIFFDGVPSAILIAFILIQKNRSKCCPKDQAFCDFFEYYFWFSALVSLTVILSFLSPEFRNIAERIFPAQGNIVDSTHPDYLYRVRGILPATGATASVYFAFGLAFGLIASNQIVGASYAKRVAAILGFVLLAMAILLNGRTGFVILALGVALFISFFIIKAISTYKINKKLFLYSLTFVILSSLGAVFIIFPMLNEAGAIKRLVEDFALIISSGGSRGTLGALKEMYFIKGTTADFLFGDVSTFKTNIIPSDVGYVRVLHATGIFGFFLFYMFWVMSYGVLFLSGIGQKLKLVSLYVILSLFLIELKEPFFIYVYSSIIVMVPICIYCLSPRVKCVRYDG
jgi:hypothetical protein